MTADIYLRSLLDREAVDVSIYAPVWTARDLLIPIISRWGGEFVQTIAPSGSFAKGTANLSGTDLDLFVSLRSDTPGVLSSYHDTLVQTLTNAGFAVRRQNVSVGVVANGLDVDIVPGRQQNPWDTDHSIYKRRGDTWAKTNVLTHIELVRQSGCQSEIRLAKLWRTQMNLDFPSFNLELAVMRALQGSNIFGLANRFLSVLNYLSSEFQIARFVDPANTNNIISDDLSAVERRAIASAASRSLRAQTWGEIVR